MSTDRKMLYAMTHFDDDPDRAAIPVVLACNALAAGLEDVWLWVTAQGVKIAQEMRAIHFFEFRIYNYDFELPQQRKKAYLAEQPYFYVRL